MGLVLAPPVQGRMLLVPLFGQASASAVAVDAGARLVARGRFGGSLVVMGERGRLGPAALLQGVLVLSAPALLCGAAAGAEGDI